MGYYVRIEKSNARIPAANVKVAYETMCALNHDPTIKKNGGSWSGGKKVEEHFSWMSPNYDQELSTAREILEELGFECTQLENGDLLILRYDNKTGQEDDFFEAISRYCEGEIEWVGEDGARWKWILGGPKLKLKRGKITY